MSTLPAALAIEPRTALDARVRVPGSKSLTNRALVAAALATAREEFLDAAFEQYDLNNQAAVSLLDLTSKYEIAMVSAMNVDTLLACGIKPCVNAEVFLAEALEKGSRRVAVIPSGRSVLPVLKTGGVR